MHSQLNWWAKGVGLAPGLSGPSRPCHSGLVACQQARTTPHTINQSAAAVTHRFTPNVSPCQKVVPTLEIIKLSAVMYF